MIPKVLLIGETLQGSSYLARRMHARECACSFATSYPQACSLLKSQGFDLVLSPMRLRDASFFSLMDLLDGSGVTLFYFHAVEESCWWMPALRNGKRCFGSSAFRPNAFACVLDQAIAEMRLDRRVVDIAKPSPARQSVSPVVVAPSSRRKLQPAGPLHAVTSALAKHTAVG